jgi:hypothetical protein
MSLKKATPKAVFDACEQLELLDRPWNRDDVRSLVGGGSFSVIDPLIQAWRKLQPVREVAPSVPTDLLIQVASMLEQQVSDYIEDIKLRDQEREKALLEANGVVAESLQKMEAELTEQLDLSQQANHDLEAECSRLERELEGKSQLFLTMELKLRVSEEGAVSLNQRLKEQQAFYENSLEQQIRSQQEEIIRTGELYQQQTNQLKLESQQQLSQQKVELLDAGQTVENRLMRLLDQGRNELKEQQLTSNSKIDSLHNDSQIQNQLAARQKLETKALESTLLQIKEDAKELGLYQAAQLAVVENEKRVLQQQVLQQVKEKDDFNSLKDSIQLLQKQLTAQ